MKIVSNQSTKESPLIGLFPSLNPVATKIEKKSITEQQYSLKAIHPVLNNEAFAQTMDKYRLFVATYNAQIQEQNKLIDKHNGLVAENSKQLTEVQKAFKDVFIKKNKSIADELEYNKVATEFNSQYGDIVELRKIQTIKYATEIVFAQFLHAYQQQLSKRTMIHSKFDIAYASTLPAVEINSHEIASFERNGVQSISLTKKSIRNHRNRLQQAGVLCNYEFQGNKKGVKHHINEEILTVFDLKTQNFVDIENQQVNPQKGKKLPDNNDNTRTIKDKYKIKENVENNSLDKGTPSAVPFNLVFYKNTQSKLTDSNMGGAPENVKIEQKTKTLSEKLTALIQNPQQLAENLSLGLYNDYSPIDLRVLSKEAYAGTMTKDEFKELVIQDFIKTTAKIWKGKNVYTGVWKKLINEMYANWFKAFNNQSFNKHIVVEMLQEYRWRVNHARKWFLAHKFNPLFPADYFDLTRTERKEVGFSYTKKAWNKHLKYEQNKELKKRKTEQKTIARKLNVNSSKEVENKVRMFLKGKIDIETLYNFVATNHPTHLEKLSEITFKIQAKLTKNL